MLMISGGLGLLMRFCIAIKPPNVVFVLAQAATTILAPGAAAEAHSASRIASPSSPPARPGLLQLLWPVAGLGCSVVSEPELYAESPKVERKVYQSEVEYRLASSITAMVWPAPV